MKHTNILSAFTAAVCLALAGCVHEENDAKEETPSPTDLVSVEFSSEQVETKTAFGEFDDQSQSFHTYWTANDKKICMSLNMDEPILADVIKKEGVSSSAMFRGVFTDGGKPYKFYALSPESAVNGISESRSSWSVSIPATQTPKEDGLSCDERAMLLYAESETFQDIPTSPVFMKFRHVPSYCRLVLKNISAALASFNIPDAVIRSIDLQYSVPVCGEWYINVADGSLTPKQTSHTITLKKEITNPEEENILWFALAPCVLDGQSVTVFINTDKGRIYREYTYGTRTYAPGAVNKLSLDMTKGVKYDDRVVVLKEDVYELVMSKEDLAVGDEIIIADKPDPEYILGTVTYSRGPAIKLDDPNGFTYSTKDNYVRLAKENDASILKITEINGDYFTLMQGDQYLYLFTSISVSEKPQKINITFEKGASTIKSRAFSSDYFLYLNDRFPEKTFSVSNKPTKTTTAVFKKKTEVTTQVDSESDPISKQDEFGVYFTDESMLYTLGINQISRKYTASHVDFAILSRFDETVVQVNRIPVNAVKGDMFEIYVLITKGTQTEYERTHRVMLVREEGSKLWLTDFIGNGFIVKR